MAGGGNNISPDELMKKIFYVILAGVATYAAVVYFFMLRTHV